MQDLKNLLNFSLINIDKPSGPTSYSISEFIRRELGLKKTSHMGTLDPKVTGVLPITLGRACKLAGYFIKHDKSYAGILHTHKEQNIKKLQGLIDKYFSGKILQIPPHRSAVKRAKRKREIYSWRLLEASEDGRDFLFECKVEGGTYIRKLCSDLGEMVGGAHMGELRRTMAGIFSEEKIYDLDEFESAVDEWKRRDDEKLRGMLVSAEDAIKEVLPVVQVEKRAIKSLWMGKPLFKGDVVGVHSFKDGEIFAAFCGKRFIGVYKRSNKVPSKIRTTKEVFGRSEFVCN
ncbi:MAG: RNA-guided pseudouridylation complex pseudouridine synthase subunit Cbf5 [Nanoarchaeota archaeon]|nr:RNA-guided pseudouridylation complex pseudouridine synthase subunit Cbf5 [Nanoarchaeota archaeon]